MADKDLETRMDEGFAEMRAGFIEIREGFAQVHKEMATMRAEMQAGFEDLQVALHGVMTKVLPLPQILEVREMMKDPPTGDNFPLKPIPT